MQLKRSTKYTSAVKAYMQTVGHATNGQILQYLRQDYPDVSATTVHRITGRMVDRGELSYAPVATDKSARFDVNLQPHDHFQCSRCDRLRDIILPSELFNSIQEMMGECRLNSRLNVQGSCETCIKGEGK